MSELSGKLRWVDEVIAPATNMVWRSCLEELPNDMSPGASQVAKLTAWRTVQNYNLAPIARAFGELEQTTVWDREFLVVDSINFDWRKAPWKRYGSFQAFYQAELETSWRAWAAMLTAQQQRWGHN